MIWKIIYDVQTVNSPHLLDSMVYWITSGVFYYAKRDTKKRYKPEFKKQVVEAVIQDGLSYQEAARIYEVQGHDRIQSWERIYLEEGPEGLALERRGRKYR